MGNTEQDRNPDKGGELDKDNAGDANRIGGSGGGGARAERK